VATGRPRDRDVPARERILRAAARLFHGDGVRATGVDAVIHAAGVAKATFYHHFPSKDGLVVAWLSDPRTRWFDRITAQAEARASGADDVIRATFEEVEDWLIAGDLRGCPYLNTATEFAEADHPAHGVIEEFLLDIRTFYRVTLERDGYRDAALLAAQIHALQAGAITLSVATRSLGNARMAGEAAQRILRNATRERKREATRSAD
jgi:AcrR family transcriptional regulator